MRQNRTHLYLIKAWPYSLICADRVSRLKTLVCQLRSYYMCIDEGSLHMLTNWDCWVRIYRGDFARRPRRFGGFSSWRDLRMRLCKQSTMYVHMFEYIFTPAENKTHLMLQGRWEKGKEPGIKPRDPGWSVAVGNPGCSAIISFALFSQNIKQSIGQLYRRMWSGNPTSDWLFCC